MRSRVVFLAVTLLATIAATSSTASALTWTSNGPSSFTATAPATKFLLATGGSPIGVTCTTAGMSGSWYGPGPSPATAKFADATLTFSSCTVAGLPGTVSCGSRSVEFAPADATSAGNTRGRAKQSATVARICTIRIASFPSCTIEIAASGLAGGFADITYSNTSSQMTFNATGQTLSVTWTNCPAGLFPRSAGSGSVVVSSLSGGSLVFTLTSAFRGTLDVVM